MDHISEVELWAMSGIPSLENQIRAIQKELIKIDLSAPVRFILDERGRLLKVEKLYTKQQKKAIRELTKMLMYLQEKLTEMTTPRLENNR